MLKDVISQISAKFAEIMAKKNAEPTKHEIKKEKEILVPSVEKWTMVTFSILLLNLLWHLQMVAGWFNGATLIDQYGMEPILVEAMNRCPDLFFYSTYISAGICLVMLGIAVWMFIYYITDKIEGYIALNVAVGCAIGTAWTFPVVGFVADLFATAINLRDTSGLDVFQLGIDGWPLIVITGVCVAVLLINDRIEKLLK